MSCFGAFSSCKEKSETQTEESASNPDWSSPVELLQSYTKPEASICARYYLDITTTTATVIVFASNPLREASWTLQLINVLLLARLKVLCSKLAEFD